RLQTLELFLLLLFSSFVSFLKSQLTLSIKQGSDLKRFTIKPKPGCLKSRRCRYHISRCSVLYNVTSSNYSSLFFLKLVKYFIGSSFSSLSNKSGLKFPSFI